MKKLILFIIIFSFFVPAIANAQKKRSIQSKIKKINYFNYQKGFYRFNGAPIFAYFNDDFTKEQIISTGIDLGFGYFPINFLNFSLNTSFDYIFNKPQDDAQNYNISLNATYYFIPKKRVSIILGFDASIFIMSYKANSTYPTYVFYNDDIDNNIHTHLIPNLSLYSGISIKIGKRFSMPIKVGYRHVFHPSKNGRKTGISPIYVNFGLYYNFNKMNRKINNDTKIKF